MDVTGLEVPLPLQNLRNLCLIAKDQSFYTRFRLIYEVRVKSWSSMLNTRVEFARI